jgi:capsular exopolysaccharide synthesis family protein
MSQEIHLRDILRILRKYRLNITICCLGAFIMAVFITMATTPVFEAKSKVIIERGETKNLTERSANLQREPEFFDTQYQMIKSRAIAARVLDILDEREPSTRSIFAAQDTSGFQLWLAWLKQKVGYADAVSAEEKQKIDGRERMIKAIAEEIRVRPLDNSRLVQISYLSPDPDFSALVVNTVVQAYVAEMKQMKTETSQSSIAWMDGKATAQANRLKEAESALQAYMGENEILSLEDRVAIIPEKLSRISSELVGAEVRRKEMEGLADKVKRLGKNSEAAESIPEVLSDQALQALRAQVVAAEKSILELSGKYGPKHPVMQKAKGDLDILRQKKDQEIARITRSIRNQYETTLLNERNLQAQFAESKDEALRMNEKFLKYQSLRAEVEANRKLYDALVLQMKEEGITGENQAVKLWTVEKAGVPTSPARPNKALNLSLGLILGLLGGVGLAFFREHLDNSIKNPDEAEIALQTPVLGTISLCRRERIEQIVMEEPLSAFAEGYKSLRTIILAGGPTPRRLLVSSSLPGEGKTSTSANLALALAQAEQRVLIIDADLRKPRIHDVFRLNNRNGLSKLLAQPLNEQKIAACLQPGPLPGLSILTAGPIPPNPSELLQSSRMKELLANLTENFDIIICDSPPVLVVEDSRILSRLFDATILVARAHVTSFEVAGRALKLLRSVKAPILGYVVNGLDQKKSDYYYHPQYYSAYQAKPLKIER